MSETKSKKPLFKLNDLWSLPLVYLAVVAAEYLWNWVFEGAAYVEWGEALRLTVFVFVFVKVGEAVRNRK